MNDADCVEFLQWALPRLRMRWAGFRKVRGQVCKRIGRRLKELGLGDIDAYRSYLDKHSEEWEILDGLCRITISRFHRDRKVFECLRDSVLPDLAQATQAAGGTLRIWSAGCASGEEPYTISILWHTFLEKRFPDITVEIIATDTEPKLLERAKTGHYNTSSLKELAPDIMEAAFETSERGLCLNTKYRHGVVFLLSDIRSDMPQGPFALILCRNLVFTYFDAEMQRDLLEGMIDRLITGGALVIGGHESLPSGSRPLQHPHPGLHIFSTA